MVVAHDHGRGSELFLRYLRQLGLGSFQFVVVAAATAAGEFFRFQHRLINRNIGGRQRDHFVRHRLLLRLADGP